MAALFYILGGNATKLYLHVILCRPKIRPEKADRSRVRGLRLPLDAPDRRRLPFLLRRCWFNLNQTFRRRIAHLGVTPDQFTVMRTVLEGSPKGLTQRQMTELMSSDPNTIASLLERMAAQDWWNAKRMSATAGRTASS